MKNNGKNFFGARRIFLRAVIVCVLSAAPARAHDCWFETDNFFAAENSSLTLHMKLGTKLIAEEERPFQIKRTVSFNLFSAQGVSDLIGKSADGAIPVSKFDTGRAGTYLVAMEHNPVGIVLDAQKFNDYLHEEELNEPIKERGERGENEKFGYERYRRFLKALIQVGDKRDDTYRKVLGFKLEIVPMNNP